MTQEFKPCPFCGGTSICCTNHGRSYDVQSGYYNVWSVCCYNCGATFPNKYRKELLVEAWNRRPGDPPSLTIEMHEAIQKVGARDRTFGKDQMDNPYLSSKNMPSNTGDSLGVYAAKYSAWLLGWTIQDMIK